MALLRVGLGAELFAPNKRFMLYVCMWVVETQICVVVVSAFCFREAAVVRGVRARDEAAGASFPKPWTPEGDGVIVTWLASRLEA
jgi:hypothetical protein